MITSSNSVPRRLRRLGLQGALIALGLAPRVQAQTQQVATMATSPLSGSLQLTNSLDDAGQAANPVGGGAAEQGFNTGNARTARTGTEGGSGATQNFDTPAALSTDKIFAVLQEQPDALLELKSLMSTLAQQQGAPIQADSITDEMLYSKIASSPELRANVTIFLRARGYVSDADLQNDAAANYEDSGFSPVSIPGFASQRTGQSTGARSQGSSQQTYPGIDGAIELGAMRAKRTRTAPNSIA